MAYRTILVDLTADGEVDTLLGGAKFLALRFDAALVCMHVTPPPFDPTVWQGGWSVSIPPEAVEAQRKANRETRARVRAAYDRVCGAEATAAWREAEGDPAQLLAAAAHASDLVVASRGAAAPYTTELLVTAAGVPVLALPPDAPRDFGHVALVGWKSSREASRAVHDALPFLQVAKQVILCAVGEGAAKGLEDAAAMLERHKVPVRPERVDGKDGSAGEVLLERAAAHGADLLVMGAYGHARLRELVFGGATRHVLQNAPLPVLFSG